MTGIVRGFWMGLAGCSLSWLAACGSTPQETQTPTPQPVVTDASTTTEAPTQPQEAAPPEREIAAADEAKLGKLPKGVGIAVKKKAPDASADDAMSGEKVSLKSLYAKGPTLVVFYRGGWCPYCNFQNRALTEKYSEFESRGVQIVAISSDQVSNAVKTGKHYKVPFTLLSDSDLEAHTAYKVAVQLSPEELEAYKKEGIDLEAASGKDHHKLAIPSYFLVDAKGVVRWAHADPDFRTRPSVEQLLAAIDKKLPKAKGAKGAAPKEEKVEKEEKKAE